MWRKMWNERGTLRKGTRRQRWERKYVEEEVEGEVLGGKDTWRMRLEWKYVKEEVKGEVLEGRDTWRERWKKR